MAVYQAHPGPNLLAWAERTVPRVGEATVKGVTAGEQVRSLREQRSQSRAKLSSQLKSAEIANRATLEKLRQSSAMFPVELEMAKTNADLARSQMERAELLHDSEMLNLARESKMTAMKEDIREAKVAEVEQKRMQKGRQVLSDFFAADKGSLGQMALEGDLEGLATHYAETAERLGEDFPFVMGSYSDMFKTLKNVDQITTKRLIIDRKKAKAVETERFRGISAAAAKQYKALEFGLEPGQGIRQLEATSQYAPEFEVAEFGPDFLETEQYVLPGPEGRAQKQSILAKAMQDELASKETEIATLKAVSYIEGRQKGLIGIFQRKATALTELEAEAATLKQRLGELGVTTPAPGEQRGTAPTKAQAIAEKAMRQASRGR